MQIWNTWYFAASFAPLKIVSTFLFFLDVFKDGFSRYLCKWKHALSSTLPVRPEFPRIYKRVKTTTLQKLPHPPGTVAHSSFTLFECVDDKNNFAPAWRSGLYPRMLRWLVILSRRGEIPLNIIQMISLVKFSLTLFFCSSPWMKIRPLMSLTGPPRSLLPPESYLVMQYLILTS